MIKFKTKIFFIMSLFVFGQYVVAQEKSNLDTIEAKGNIVAVDVWADAGNLTNAPQQQIFIFHINYLIKGKEKSSYIKVINKYYGNTSPLPLNSIKSEDNIWQFKLSRETACDSTLEQMKYAKAYILDSADIEKVKPIIDKIFNNSNEVETKRILRLKDIDGLTNISDEKILPCYVVENYLKKQPREIKGTIVAYDGFVNASNITYAPQQQIFIVRVDETLQGDEKSNYIKVIYEYFSSEDEFVSDLLSGKKNHWNFILSKDCSCNSTLKQMKYVKVKSLSNGKEIGTQIKLKDLGGLDDISEDTNLPCYRLKSNGIDLPPKM